MKHMIEIDTECKKCGYANFAPERTHNSYTGVWKCNLFGRNLSDRYSSQISTKIEQCSECRQIVKNHLATPEFEG